MSWIARLRSRPLVHVLIRRRWLLVGVALLVWGVLVRDLGPLAVGTYIALSDRIDALEERLLRRLDELA